MIRAQELAEQDRAEWERHFDAIARSALVQSWAYGAAKAAEGWIPHRMIFRDADGQPVALAQILERRLVGLLSVTRLNRGPHILVPGHETEIMTWLRRRWRWFKGGMVTTAPSWSGDEWAARLRGWGYRRLNRPNWHSAWLDLRQDEATIRANLKGKWRNILVKTEKAGINIEISTEMEALRWLLAQHGAFMRGKGLDGLSPGLAMSLHGARFRPDDLLVLRAGGEEGLLGGILLVRHGHSATYLIGWSSPEGRTRNCSTLLLWRGLLALKDRGVHWLDLGGIDPTGTPGVAAFKQGLRGEEFTLVGEYVSW
jgi:lipid II:glycine glycyltransferase (peptidoglycan interpeptide bridge formation enzyme)